jgi:putative membrane protein
MLNAMDQSRIEAAVTKAEAGSSGEIICVLAREVSHYPEVALAWAAAVALALPALVLTLGVHPLVALADPGVWMAAQAGALESELAVALGFYAAIQAGLFILTFLIIEFIPAVRRPLTPAALKRHRVERAARAQFAAIAARAQGSETGVLIFVAVDDRQVQILAAPSLHQKADDAAWKAAAAAIGAGMKPGADPTAGIVQAVEICGAVLRAHFPAPEGRDQVFSNHPVEI